MSTTMRHRISTIAVSSLALGLAGAVHAGDSITEALTGGKVNLDMRYRYENVDQPDTIKDTANASTLRTRLGYTTGTFNDLGATLEFENVTVVGDEKYNDGTPDGDTDYSTVKDPATTEVNQAFLSYTGLSDTTLMLGRQRVMLDNARFVGNSGWRQNEQTFDAFAVVNKSLPDTQIVYGYVSNINGVTGNDDPAGDLSTSSHVLNVAYSGFAPGILTGYGYFLDVDDAPSLSSQTVGVRFTGKHALDENNALLYTAEYAQQSDYADNTANYNLGYYLIELGGTLNGITAKYGYENLGGDVDEGAAVQTPIASAHPHNGWADVFTSTPVTGSDAGLVDQYLSVGGALSGVQLAAVYHDYGAADGNADYGTEWDAVASYTWEKMYTVGAKYATYNADTFPSTGDVDKFWVWGEVKF